MSEANKRVALAFIKSMSDADADAMAALLTPDCVTVTKGFAQVSGTRNRA